MAPLNRKYIILSFTFLVWMLIGFVTEFAYKQGPERSFSAEKFTDKLHHQINLSDQLFQKLSAYADDESYHNVEDLLSNQHDCEGYVFNGDVLLFWSTNQFDIYPFNLNKDSVWHFIELNNAYGIYKWQYSLQGYGILSFIPIKSAFPYENEYLKNEFIQSLHITRDVTISGKKTPHAHPIYDKNNHFLFSLTPGYIVNNGNTLRYISFIAFFIAFCLLLLLYYYSNAVFKTRKLKKNQFWWITGLFGAGLLALCYYDYPTLLFNNPIFHPQQYAANQLIKTFTHLSLLCFFLITSLIVYLVKVKKGYQSIFIKRAGLYLYIFIFFETTKSMMINSSISFNLLMLKENMLTNIWTQFLIFTLTFGLFIMLQITQHDPSKRSLKQNLGIEILFILLSAILYSIFFQHFMVYFVFFVIIIIAFDVARRLYFINAFDFKTFGIYFFILNLVTLFISYQFNEFKKFNKYRILTENILVNGNSENDPIAELLLEELDKNLREDSKIQQLITKPDSTTVLTKYVFSNYLSGFWNKYNVTIKSIAETSENYVHYQEYLRYNGKQLKETGFFSLPASLYDLSFIGLVDIGTPTNTTTNILILEFEPKRNFRSYSFPDLLISKESNLLNQTNTSIAKYENDQLVYSDLRYEWPERDTTFRLLKDGFEKITTKQHKFYVLTRSSHRIIITRIATANITTLSYYFIFTFLLYLLLGRIFFWIYAIRTHRRTYITGLTAKFQLVFISLLLLSFMGILFFSTEYISNNYQQEQIASIEKKKQYLQKSLQDLYYWTEDISTIDAQSLKNNLEELAYRYQTDINIYNNDGKLMGSSQPLIFSKHLLGQLISPKIFFSDEVPGNQYEKIGNLNYLAAYTDMINGDYLQIGYISIPQYLSQTEINAKIEQFLMAIIQIYLIIIVFSIILIIIVGKQLADPLHLLQIKLKSMRLDGKNEKVEYKWKDEIGQLVEQYNKTVDELEKNTQLLLQSERETAWRTMARQIAHEINNPLTPMKLTIQQLMRTKKMNREDFDAYFEKSTQTLIEQIDNLSKIAGTFSQFARMPETTFSIIDIAAKLFSVVELFKNNHENIDILYQGKESNVFVNGDGEQLLQVFNNILKNATQSINSEAQGKIVVELTTVGTIIQIKFSDNGVGIPDSIQRNIFSPNFTTKSYGMGLGLSISKNFIEHMNGEISFSSDAQIGTTFVILLPKDTKQ